MACTWLRSTCVLSLVMPSSVMMATMDSLSLRALKPALTGPTAIMPASPINARMADCTTMITSLGLTLLDGGVDFIGDDSQ